VAFEVMKTIALSGVESGGRLDGEDRTASRSPKHDAQGPLTMPVAVDDNAQASE
jgi:hypothetical protein